MAHGKRPGPISKILVPSSQLCADPVVTKVNQEEHRGLVRESRCTLKDDNDDRLTPPVPGNQLFRSCDPGPEDMEDTCSEYDNVGSDVEQNCDEVLHLSREGVVNVRNFNQYCPENSSYIKPAEADIINERCSAAEQVTQRPHHATEICKGSHKDTKPLKTNRRFSSHHPTEEEVLGEMESVQENRYFLSDTDDIEEVLDGARFIEDLEETGQSLPKQSSLYQDNESERFRKAGHDGEREGFARNMRNRNVPGTSKKVGGESPHMASKEKERHAKGRGRRGAGENTEQIVSGIKGYTINSVEHRPKMSTKDCKKTAARTKARYTSSKQHPPPPPHHSHAHSHVSTQRAQLQRETTPPPTPSPIANSQESNHHFIKPTPDPHHTPEHQREPTEEPTEDTPEEMLENPQHVTTTKVEEQSTAVMPEDTPAQQRTPQCPEADPAEDNTPKKTQETAAFPSFEDVPGPCEPEDLIDGIIFAANFLGCTQVMSDKNPTKSVRMSQAQEAVSRIKSQDEDSQMVTEVDLFISTKAVKVLNADTQETMMDSALRTISYIADIGSIVVLMARRRVSQATSEDFSDSPVSTSEGKSQYRMICYVFESEDAQLIAQSIGQAFSVAYREFLRANGINPTDLSHRQYSDIINSQEMYHDDLIHFSNSDNCKELYVEKQKGENLGVVIVESGWGSILPTVILANMLNSGPAARSGKLSVGDQIMSINDTSLVGLPLTTCQGIIKGLKNQVKVKLSIVSCPPVTTVLIKRPDLKFQLGFSVQNGIICSLMRGGIAERGGVRVGHRIIEINGQSVVAMAHEKIVQTLSISVGEINMKTMPAVMFRLLTGQETPVYI
ncbi:amyloid-beta A4 precursor protein-binding family A member 2 isoform X2 [Thalassophryne amazonica]|uniref:amyloid-beta A4 precursor protein-binding family A member 2 isoform X2 n=1 Tax=Thalassophryne amazonica TaxID=390379 RepID=UPI0014716C53|nr:amyloid-beta A4 precursor protein-binding family A member 2 isoform X2 [Thalassophryne amazonica]